MNRILFLGSRLQSYRCFRYLLDHYPQVEIVAVAPNVHPVNIRPDQDITELAQQNSIRVISRDQIDQFNFDLGISLLYDSVLSEQEIAIPTHGFVNFHLGPLPRLKGSNSVMHAIRLARSRNCWEFEVTLHYIVRQLDSGPIIDTCVMPIFEDDTAYSLHCRASEKVYELFVRNIDVLLTTQGELPARPQTGESGFYKKQDVDHFIDLNSSADEIYDCIRALSYPGKPRPYTLINNKKIYLTLDEI